MIAEMYYDLGIRYVKET